MSMVRVYLYAVGQKVIIPTLAETEAGFFVETEPVHVFSVSQVNEWKALMYRSLSEGNPLIPTPDENVTPGSPILEKLDLRKWADFEKQALLYTIHVGPRFVSVYVTGKNEEGKWTKTGRERQFEAQAPLEVVVDEVALDLIKEPEAIEKPMLLLGG